MLREVGYKSACLGAFQVSSSLINHVFYAILRDWFLPSPLQFELFSTIIKKIPEDYRLQLQALRGLRILYGQDR